LVVPRAFSFCADRCIGKRGIEIADVLDFCERAYALTGVNLRQLQTLSEQDGKLRLKQTVPPVSDLYFLAQHCELLEVLEDPARNFTATGVSTASGRLVEADLVFKCLGFETSYTSFDEAMGVENMVGFWVDSDPRHFVLQEPVGHVDLTSWPLPFYNPHYMMSYVFLHYLENPAELADMNAKLPRSDKCAYDNLHIQKTYETIFSSMTPKVGKQLKEIRDKVVTLCRGEGKLEQFLLEQRTEWEAFAAGSGKKMPPYPYSVADFEQFERCKVAQSGDSSVTVVDLRSLAK
jgi:hypothetical protein